MTPNHVRVETIPLEMKAANRWLVWKFGSADSAVKRKKVPRSVATGEACDPTDPKNLSSFDDALAAYSTGRYDGIGFALGDDYVGVDQDDCYDAKSRALTPAAASIVAELDSYTEISPSGSGVKTFIRSGNRLNYVRAGLEIYGHDRYFTVTGQHLAGTPTTVEQRAIAEARIADREFAAGINNDVRSHTPTLPDRIDHGGRNDFLFREAARLREHGATDEEILAYLTAVNTSRVNPPVDDLELRKIVESACRYKPGTGMDPVKPRFAIHNRETLISRPAAPFLVKDLLVKGSLIALVAEPNVGKTFITSSLVLAVAAGRDSWLGKPLRASGPVVYVIAEGLGRFKYRIMAWEQVHQTVAKDFYWIDEPVALLDDKTANAFVSEVASLQPALVVIDTLSRCLMGGNENSQEDMGKAVAVCDDLRARAGCAVIVVHHTKKDGSVERGSTVLRGAADTLLMVKEESRGILTMTCEKQKDADAFDPIQLVRRTIQLDDTVDPETGDPVSSCVIQLADPRDLDRASVGVRRRIANLLAQRPAANVGEVAKALGGRKAEIVAMIDEMEASGEIRVSKGSKGAKILTFVPPDARSMF